MTYLSDKAKERKRNLKFLFIGFCLLVVVIFWPQVQSTIYPYIEPVVFVFSDAKQAILYVPKTIYSFFHSRSDYEKQIVNLSDNIERLENNLAFDEAKISEYEANSDEQLIPGKVMLLAHPLMTDVSQIYSTIILSKGFRDGVEVGSIVYLRGRQPIGTIGKVHDKTSELSLLSSANNKINGVINNTTVIPLLGNGGGNFIGNVIKNTDVKIGDTIYCGDDTSLILGTVADIKNDPQDVSMIIYVRGAYNPMKANNFYIEK